jgi:hypothetical protein
MLTRRATTWVVGLVSGVWAVNFLAGIAIPSYDGDQAINGIFMAIVGGVLALGRKGSKDDDPKDGAP